jgi:molecular chaperone GrpE (heat shock protein)
MNSNFEATNKHFAGIYEQLKDIYEKLSREKGDIKEYLKGNSLWEQIFPGVLLMKNIELINSQMQDLLNLTHSLGRMEDDKVKLIDSTEDEMQGSQEEYDNLQNTENELALDIIKLRDQIFIAKYSCSEKQQKILLSLYEELGRILKINGIEPLEEEKIFNSQYHIVIDTKVTDKIQLNNTIAETYRPGYKINGKILRAQEVVLYRYEPLEDNTK